MKVFKQLKGDCCSHGGGGWSSKKKDRTRCEPCKTSNKGKLGFSWELYLRLEVIQAVTACMK